MSVKNYKFSYIIVGVSVLLTIGFFYYGKLILEDLEQLRKSETTLFIQSQKLDKDFREFQRALGFGGFIHNIKEFLLERKENQLFILEANIEEIEVAYNSLRSFFQNDEAAYSLKTLDDFVVSIREKYNIIAAPKNRDLTALELDNLLNIETPEILGSLITLESLKGSHSTIAIREIQKNIENTVNHLLFASALMPVFLVVGIYLSWLLNRSHQTKMQLMRSEANMLQMIKKSPLPMVISDSCQNILLFNDKFTDLFGYTLADVSSAEKWWEIAYPNEKYREKVQRSWLAAIEVARENNTDIEMQEWDLTIKDRTKRTCEFHMVPFEDSSLIVMNDITERMIAERQIKESEELFKALFEQTGGYSMILRPSENGIPTIIDANNAACEAHGYTRDELIGRPVIDLDDEEGKRLCVERTQLILLGKALNIENIHVRKDGSTFPVAVFANVVRFKNNPPLILTTEYDISKREKAEAEKNILQQQLQQAQKMEAIGNLAGGIAHDFNNILSAILGYAEMILDDCPAGSSMAHDINQVLKSGNRATELVKQILAFSRQAETDQIPVKPVIIIKEAIKMLRASLPTTITIEQDIDPEVGVILADPTQIHQILMNICTNASHAMEKKGGTLTISLQKKTLSQQDLINQSHMQPGNFIQLSIRDTGVGISPEIKEKIFDPYFTTKEVGKGTGMGLAIVHGIVQSYGGSITCNSRLGEGTLFQVTLPIVEENHLHENVTPDIILGGNEHILLVDDEKVLTEMGMTLLKRLGYRVTSSTNSIAALTIFKNQPETFDLIITDQTMPGMTGVDLSRIILQIRPDMPIILCTGYSSIISEDKAKSMGIKGFAMKPLAKKDIAVLIRKVLAIS